jgi:hypothetical protein
VIKKGCALETVSTLSRKNKGGFERMKKNLKKVISAVLSLTLALGSFAALGVTGSAATFSDVADTASYSEAVEVLASLGAISGYEDGTFLPNNNITRAEVVTMVVAALNMTEDAKNSGSSTQFADVNTRAAWAAGYVNVGVAQGFISGMSETEYAPSENVTYAQILSMLTRILGYGDFAVSRGGYPNGYLTAASTAGILSGVSASANDPVTRAQVAQLIWNALQAPVLDITTFSTTSPESEKMDGKNGRDFRTILSDKFNAYVLNVKVEETSRQGDLDAGTVRLAITGSNDYNPDTEVIGGKETLNDVDAGKTAVEDYPFSSAKVVAEFNDDDEWTLLYFAPTSKVVQKSVDGTLVSGFNSDLTQLQIKKSKNTTNTTNYKLASTTDVYVNGVLYGQLTAANEDDVINILENSVGDTVLVESDVSGTYNRILVDYYVVARLSQINVKSDSTQLTLAGFKAPGNVVTVSNAKNTVKINNDDVEDGSLSLTVQKAGVAAELSSLAKDDVVAFRYDITGTIEGSSFIEILATTDTVTGKYTSYDDTDELYTVGGNDYESVADLSSDLEIGTSYTFKLDPLGRLFDYDVEATSKNFAIVERYVESGSSSSSEYDYIQVMTLDGNSKTLYIDSNYETTAGNLMDDMGIKSTVKATARATKIADRVIEYTVKTSTGRVNSISKVTDIKEANDETYNATTNRLGNTLASGAVVLDATDYPDNEASGTASLSDYKASSLAGLSDGAKYDALLIYKQNNEYNYVIVLSAGAIFTGTDNFAVAAVDGKTSSKATVNDEEVYSLDVMVNGASDSEKLYIATDAKINYNGEEKGITAIKEGSVFYYTLDSDGFVDKIAIVYQGGKSFTTLYQTTSAEMSTFIKLPELASSSNAFATDDWIIDLDSKAFSSNADDEIQLVLAPIYNATSKAISIGTIKYDSESKTYYVDTNEVYDYSVTDETNIYSYDMSGDSTGKYAFSSGAFIGMETKEVDDQNRAWLGDHTTDGELDYNHANSLQMAILMIVDGTVTNALVLND